MSRDPRDRLRVGLVSVCYTHFDGLMPSGFVERMGARSVGAVSYLVVRGTCCGRSKRP